MTKRIAGIDYSLTSPAICVWKSTNDGIFNFEGGCYAKAIKLNSELEPDIFNAINAGFNVIILA